MWIQWITINTSAVIDKNLNHDLNTTAICKQALQTLHTFNVDKTLMVLLYKSF